METKFTPKRWEIRPTDSLNENGKPLFYDITVDGSGFLSTHKNMYIEGLDDEMQLANAKLVVAAPEMFEMLKDMFSYLNSGEKAEAEEMLSYQIQQLLTKITQ